MLGGGLLATGALGDLETGRLGVRLPPLFATGDCFSHDARPRMFSRSRGKKGDDLRIRTRSLRVKVDHHYGAASTSRGIVAHKWIGYKVNCNYLPRGASNLFFR